MIEIYTAGKNWQRVKKLGKRAWINVVNPTEEDFATLKRYISLPEDVIAAVKDPDEIPSLERHPSALFILVRVPVRNPSEDLEYYTTPLGILITSGHLVTISQQQNDTIERFKSMKPSGGITSALILLFVSARTYQRSLKDIGKEVYQTQQNLEQAPTNAELLQLLELEKSLVYFDTALKANKVIAERLARSKLVTAKIKHKDLTQDILDETQQAMSVTKTYSIVTNNIVSAFSSIISNNLNRVMKTLTGITLVIMIPTLIASIYGMNIALPFQQHPHAFLLIVGLSTLFSIIGAVIFRAKLF